MRAVLPKSTLKFHHLAIPVLLLLLFWSSRIAQLDALPLHVDEGIHIRTALMVYEGDPLWRISNGKIIGHWPIALLQPQHAAAFVSRMATVLVVMLGAAAGYALVRQEFGGWAATFAILFWLASSYMFFFERTALMDAQTGALVVLATWAALGYLHRDRLWRGILTGLLLLAALLYKLTALPALATVGFLLLFYGDFPLQQRLKQIAVIGLTLAICMVIPLPFILPRLLGSSGGAGLGSFSTGFDLAQITANLQAFNDALTSFGGISWALMFLGLVFLILRQRKDGLILALAPLPLLVAIIVFSSEVYLRYFAVVLPLWLLFTGAGLGDFFNGLQQMVWRWMMSAIWLGLLLLGFLPFALTAYTSPGDLHLPDFMRLQYITEHSSGFGLREAAEALPQGIARPDLPIVASMFADSCRRTNYYTPDGFELVCADALGAEAIEAALAEQGAVYVLEDRPPYTGIDLSTIDGEATLIAAYPRPGDPEDQPAITLWLVERRSS